MSSTIDWESALKAKEEEISRYWLTRSDFESAIDEILAHPDSPLDGLRFLLRFDAPFHSFEIGHSSAGEADSQTVPLDDNRGGRCTVRWWSKTSTLGPISIRSEQVLALLRAWWKPQLRTPSAGLPDLKRDKKAIQLAEATVSRQLKDEERPAVLFCDLDNFKSVNAQFGYSGGDRVMKQFGALAESAVAPYGVLLHKGGDELVVLCPKRGAMAAIQAGYALHEAVVAYDFQVSPMVLRLSAGMASTDSPRRTATFDELREEAENESNTVKNSKKGRARFKAIDEPSVTSDWALEDFVALGKSLVLSAVSVRIPFGNAWLNALSTIIADAGARGLALGTVTKLIQDFVEWMDPANAMTPMPPNHPPEFLPLSSYVSTTATPLVLAFAIAHGVLASTVRSQEIPGLILRYSSDGLAAGVYLPNGAVLWCSDPAVKLTEECKVPIPPQAVTTAAGGQKVCPRAVLVKIGHSPLPVPAYLFSEIIVVDDRPTRGGSLPDFWEVTIARLVYRVYVDPNIDAVFVIGNRQHGVETVARLRNVADWHAHAEEMASRLSVTPAIVSEAANRINERIYFSKDYQELVRNLSNTLENAPPTQMLRQLTPAPRPFLDRPLAMGNMVLRSIDGCRVETAAEAFPVVLEIIRNADQPPVRDQAGRQIRELVDFKVHLMRPERDMIADFYRGQEARMVIYFQDAFLNEREFFGKGLRVGGQLDAVIDHVAKVIRENELAFATRRAILVIPHEIIDREELSPLGLVSVRVIPRFYPGRCELSYSFTWRTVEVLVGFPYSLYGSIRMGQELTNLVRSRLAGGVLAQVTMGEVSYIAHSLHMFMDDFGQAIVRHIVNDATR